MVDCLGGRVAEWHWMGRQLPYGCGFESRAPHREGGYVTAMLRGVLIGWFNPGWQAWLAGFPPKLVRSVY